MKPVEGERQHILVCANDMTGALPLLRAAEARAGNAAEPPKITVLHVKIPGKDVEHADRLSRFMRFAEHAGADTVTVEGANKRGIIADFVLTSRQSGAPVTHVIVGQSRRSDLPSLIFPSFAEKIAADLRRVCGVEIIPLNPRRRTGWIGRDRIGLRALMTLKSAFYIFGLPLAAAMLLSLPVRAFAGFPEPSSAVLMLCFTAVCVTASTYAGTLAGLAALAVSVLCLFAADSANVIGGGDFVLFAFTVSLLCAFAGRGYTNVSSLLKWEKHAAALNRLNKIAYRAEGDTAIYKELYAQLERLFKRECLLLLPQEGTEELRPAREGQTPLTENDSAAAKYCAAHGKPAGAGCGGRFRTKWRFEPAPLMSGKIGVLGVLCDGAPPSSALVAAAAEQIAAVIERAELARAVSAALVREEKEKLRVMLLSSISHDLKTPLASVIGSLSVLKTLKTSGRLTAEQEGELTDTALEEARRLNSFVTNILDMTRLESGAVEFDMQWHDPSTAYSRLIPALRARFTGHSFTVEEREENGGYDIYADISMTQQALQNLLENAAKYSPEGTEIVLSAGRAENGEGYIYRVRDAGPGIPAGKEEKIFDKYERLKEADSKVAGTGLGLAICRMIMRKQEGDAYAEEHNGKGASFALFLPQCRKHEDLYGEKNYAAGQ